MMTTYTHAAGVEVQHAPSGVHISTPYLSLNSDRKTGLWEAHWRPAGSSVSCAPVPHMQGVSSEVLLSDGTTLTLADYTQHECRPADVTHSSGSFGDGMQIIVHHRAAGRPELRQRFTIYANRPFFFVRLEAINSSRIATNNMSVMTMDQKRTRDAGIYLRTSAKPRTLFVPFDNDAWVRYNSDGAISYEVTALYDDTSRNGFVIGSVTHDVWKTGMVFGNVTPGRVGDLRVYGGTTGEETRDRQSHGIVRGTTVSSPQILVGYFADWREGMETYGRTCAHFQPALPWMDGVPFGWNSWSAYKETVNAAHYTGVSDFLKNKLQAVGFENHGPIFVNFDSFWDNLNEAQLQEAARHVRANGQRPGIYWTPFVYWGDDFSRTVEGTDGKYTYRDILLKDNVGKPLSKLDGGWPLDPTHPGTLQRIDWQMGRFVQWGFDFVKLDFMTHGALEGAHFNHKITTGIQAYNLGMQHLVAAVSPAKIGRPFFISLSIAPLFPSGYAHSRRISCDSFGAIHHTEYMLNSLTYGWWEDGTLYQFTDPDHSVLYQEHGQPPTSEAEGRSRLNASVIAGTVLLDGDDLTEPGAQARAEKLLSNRDILALARMGKAFRPVQGDTGWRAADLFVLQAAGTKDTYTAVFNFSEKDKATKTIDLTRLGLPADATFQRTDLWTGQTTSVKGSFTIDLAPAESTILRLTPQ